MSDFRPVLHDQQRIDADHLNVLAIFHFIAAGLAVAGLGFLVLHYTLMSAVFANPKLWQQPKGGPSPEEWIPLLKWVYVVCGVLFGIWAILNLISGIFLRTRKHRLFSLIVAALNCVQIPLGTILGAFTIVVLVRDSVRELYEGAVEEFAP